MPSFTRLAALFTSVLLVAFVMVTSGFACISPSNSRDMGGMGMASTHADGSAAAPQATPDQKVPAAPCKFPWAPDGCQSMVPCAPAALASSTAALNRGGALPERVAPSLALVPLSVTTPPELPPPRA
jgi:hypothetical protein